MSSSARHLSTHPRGSLGRRRARLAVAAAAVLVAVGIPAASATTSSSQQSLNAVCSATIPLNISPGLFALKHSQGTNQSFGETGTLNCTGKLDGHRIAGPGTVGFAGHYGGTCNATTGVGKWSFSLPVDDNGVTRVIHHAGAYDSPGVSLAIVFNGKFETGRLTGTGLVTPVQGDCLAQPMTKATFTLVGLQLTQ